MIKTVKADIVIVGGGIAGLWLLNRLRKAGFTAILLEARALGGGQTLKSQGIIHGGMKYALQGTWTQAANIIADMPNVWKRCLEGKGEIDLREVPILSSNQHLWSPSKLASKITGFFAGFALNNQVQAVDKSHYPAIFQNPRFKGEIYSLDEIVIDVPSLVRELVKPNQDALFKIAAFDDTNLHLNEQGGIGSIEVRTLKGDVVQIQAQRYVFAAGAGNEMILKKLNLADIIMQRRPLHMVLVKTAFNYPLYAHCMGLGTVPRMTITTHLTHDGQQVWYLGGQIAEDGVTRDSPTQIQMTQRELQSLFPWLDFSTAQFASFMVDRAEPAQPNGKRPDGVFAKTIENAIVAWPTKLALAPRLADEIIQLLTTAEIKPQLYDTRELRSWPMPPLARPIWDELLCSNVAA